MPASPISKKMTLPDNWVQLQKTMIPDSETSCYWSVWYDVKEVEKELERYLPDELLYKGTAWLMWCPFGENPAINDNWGHAEEIDESCRNILIAVEKVYGVGFHEHIFTDLENDPIV